MGKGTIYEYFKNKEDIVFEIINIFIAEHERRLFEITQQDISTKEKLFHFCYMIHDEISSKQLNIYREFLAISMTNGTQEMIEFTAKCREKFIHLLTDILQKGIDKGEINKNSQGFVSALLTFNLGLIVEAHTVPLNAKEEIVHFLELFFSMIKKDK